MEYNIAIAEDKYKKEILKFVVLNLDLTKSEFSVLEEIIQLNTDLIDTNVRLYLRNTLGKSEHSINNYIMKLKEKNILKDTQQGLIVNSNIVNMVNDEDIIIKFNIKQSVN